MEKVEFVFFGNDKCRFGESTQLYFSGAYGNESVAEGPVRSPQGGGNDGIVFFDQVAQCEDDLRLFYLTQRTGHGSCAQRFGETCQGGLMRLACRVIQVVAPQLSAKDLLQQVIGLIGGSRGTYGCQRTWTVLLVQSLKFSGHPLQGLIPAGLHQFAVFFYQGSLEPLRARQIVKAVKAALTAGVPITRRCCGSGGHSKELISLDVQHQIATTAAVGAEGLHLFIMKWPGFARTYSFLQGPGGAQIEAEAARDTVGV